MDYLDLPINSMVIFHGYVTNNQMVTHKDQGCRHQATARHHIRLRRQLSFGHRLSRAWFRGISERRIIVLALLLMGPISHGGGLSGEKHQDRSRDENMRLMWMDHHLWGGKWDQKRFVAGCLHQ